LLLQGAGNRLHLLAQGHEARLRLQNGQLGAQHQHVEALGFFIVVQQGRGQVCHLLTQLLQAVDVQRVPRRQLGEFLHRLAPGPHHKVVQVHGGYLLVQKAAQFATQLRIGQ